MMATNSSEKRIYVPPFAARLNSSLFRDRRRRLGRVVRAFALVIGWFVLLFVALWSEIACVAALQRAMNPATFLRNSPPGDYGKPFRW